jgi:hypothetical protein
MRRSHTSVVERNRVWDGVFETEPYEAAWASEAIFFVRTLDASGPIADADADARVQISPDGIHWCDEGTQLSLAREPGVTFAKVAHFGGFLRLVGEVPNGAEIRVIVYLTLKA